MRCWDVVLMAGTFSERIDALQEMTGRGQSLTGTVTVSQVYAHRQHEDLSYHHPRGGGPKYLERPLMSGYRDYLGDYARTVLADGGQQAMQRSMEHLSDQVEATAPREWGDLLKSGHPKVTLGGATVYDRAPKAARLTDEELKAKSRATLRQRLAEGLTVYFMRNGKVIRIPGKNEPHELRGRL
jgi:hypothetical protein